MKQLKNEIAKQLKSRLDGMMPENGLQTDDISAMFEYPPDPEMGDLAFPCFKLSKILRKAPPQIAAALGDNLEIDGIARIQAVSGYLNFFADNSALAASVIRTVLTQKERYGGSEEGTYLYAVGTTVESVFTKATQETEEGKVPLLDALTQTQ